MRFWGTNSQATRGCAALLIAVLPILSACTSIQATNAPAISDSESPAVKRAAAQRAKARAPAKTAVTKATIDPARIRALAAQAAPDDPVEQERLFREFMKWSKARQKL